MISAKQARNIVKRIDWSERVLNDINRAVNNLAQAGHTVYRYKFSDNIPDGDKEKVIIKLQALGYYVFLPYLSPENQNWIDINWKEEIKL